VAFGAGEELFLVFSFYILFLTETLLHEEEPCYFSIVSVGPL
jgi:hypothetical protein